MVCRSCDEEQASVVCHFCHLFFCSRCVVDTDLCPNCFTFWTPDLITESWEVTC